MRADLREPAREEVGGEGVPGARRVGLRAGGVDDRPDRQAPPVDQGDLQIAVRAEHVDIADLARPHVDPSGRAGLVQGPGDHRGQAVAQDVPAPQVVGQEVLAVGRGEGGPEAGGEGAEPVHGHAPVAVLPQGGPDVVAHRRAQPGQTGRERQADRRDAGSRPVGVGAGQQPVPGDGVHDAAGALQRQRHVDHGQARSHDQDVAVRGHPAQRVRRPRVHHEAGGRRQRRGRPRAARRWRPGGQDDGVGDHIVAGGEAQRQAGAARRHADHPVPQSAQHPVPAGHRREVLGEVAPEERARREVAGRGVGPPRAAEPAHEVARVVDARAHPPGRHVQQVALVGGAVGHAPPHLLGVADQEHPVGRARRPHGLDEPRGGHRPGGPGSHDSHGRCA